MLWLERKQKIWFNRDFRKLVFENFDMIHMVAIIQDLLELKGNYSYCLRLFFHDSDGHLFSPQPKKSEKAEWQTKK